MHDINVKLNLTTAFGKTVPKDIYVVAARMLSARVEKRVKEIARGGYTTLSSGPDESQYRGLEGCAKTLAELLEKEFDGESLSNGGVNVTVNGDSVEIDYALPLYN